MVLVILYSILCFDKYVLIKFDEWINKFVLYWFFVLNDFLYKFCEL